LPPKPTESKKHHLVEHGVDGSGSGEVEVMGVLRGKTSVDHGDRRGRSDEDASGENNLEKLFNSCPKNEFFFDTKNDDTRGRNIKVSPIRQVEMKRDDLIKTGAHGATDG